MIASPTGRWHYLRRDTIWWAGVVAIFLGSMFVLLVWMAWQEDLDFQSNGIPPAYLAMSYLYKRSNFLWYFLIRHRLTGVAWRPLVEWTRRRHLRFRRRLEFADEQPHRPLAASVVAAGV